MATINSLLPRSPSLAAPASRRAPLKFRGVRAESTPSASVAPSINLSIKKDEAKVVDTVLVSELQKPLQAYCRAFKSYMGFTFEGIHVTLAAHPLVSINIQPYTCLNIEHI